MNSNWAKTNDGYFLSGHCQVATAQTWERIKEWPAGEKGTSWKIFRYMSLYLNLQNPYEPGATDLLTMVPN